MGRSVATDRSRFYKKVQLDEIRDANHRLKDKMRLYHMIFTGPPGTGKVRCTAQAAADANADAALPPPPALSAVPARARTATPLLAFD